MVCVLRAQELEAVGGFWSAFKESLQARCGKQNLQVRELSANEIEVTTRDCHALRVTFRPTDGCRHLSYELEDGTLKDLQFVLAGRAYFRCETVNYSVEGLGQKMFGELLAPR